MTTVVPAIELYPEPRWNHDRALYEVGQTPTHLIDVLPMIVNHRIVLTPKQFRQVWDIGWCFHTLEDALDALRAWDGDPEHMKGFIKRIP